MMFISPYHSLSALWRATVQSPLVRGKPELHHSDLFSLEDLPGAHCSHHPWSALTLPKGYCQCRQLHLFLWVSWPWSEFGWNQNLHQSFVPDQIIWWDVFRVFLWAFTVVSPRATVWSSHIEHYRFCFLTACRPQLEEPKSCMCGWGMSIFSLADCKCHLYVNFSDCMPPFCFGDVDASVAFTSDWSYMRKKILKGHSILSVYAICSMASNGSYNGSVAVLAVLKWWWEYR